MGRDEARSRRVTRADVARAAGVSTAVVSYVMNGGPRPVAPETAARVRAAMDDLGYRPNHAARTLNLGTTRTIGLVLQDTLNPYFAEFAGEIDRAARERGFGVLTAESHGDRDAERRLLSDLSDRQVDALLLASSGPPTTEPAVANPRDPTTVLLDCAGPVAGHHTIGPDAASGARAAVAHLAQVHGRRRIGMVIGPDGLASPDPRLAGWRSETEARGVTPGAVAVDDWSNAGGYRAARRLLDTGALPDALFVGSDAQAIGVLRALLEAGIDIPRACPIVSFDGTGAGDFTWPALTSARQPVREMADLALALVAHPDPDPRHHASPVDLVIRESCGCPLTPPVATPTDS